MPNQIKSKQRVAEHGEVFTAEREVNAMLDMVKDETDRVDSRFLEPACGDGNFLAEILRRKLQAAKRQATRPRGTVVVPQEFERQAVMAVTSIYGVDLLQDNVEACRERLFGIWNKEYTAICKENASEECRDSVRFILSRNILCGNALTLVKVDEKGNDTEEPIIFSEWAFVSNSLIKRRDFRLDVLLKENPDEDMYSEFQTTMFGADAECNDNWEIDPVTNNWIPKAIAEFPPTDYRRVSEYGE